jgi:hypothetical protein
VEEHTTVVVYASLMTLTVEIPVGLLKVPVAGHGFAINRLPLTIGSSCVTSAFGILVRAQTTVTSRHATM